MIIMHLLFNNDGYNIEYKQSLLIIIVGMNFFASIY